MNKIIYYYQSFVGLKSILNQKNTIVTDIFISSIHFGINIDGSPYIHLNDYPPDDNIFDNVWKEAEEAHKLGIRIHLMIGGAGGAYGALYTNFEVYYKFLMNLIKEKSFICGINLDIEEYVLLEDVRMLINRLDDDFGNNFLITMAPVSFSLVNDVPGMGDFCYKDLLNTDEGQRINWFNGQFYGSFSFDTYDRIIKNGYDEEKIAIGMLSSEFDKNTMSDACNEIKKIYKKYNNFAGVYTWEYCNAPPSRIDNPGDWAIMIKNSLKCCRIKKCCDNMRKYFKI